MNTTPSILERQRRDVLEGDPDATQHLFTESKRREVTADTIKTFLNSPSPELATALLDNKGEDEIKNILNSLELNDQLRLRMALDYQKQMEFFQFLDILKMGQTSYTSDYPETAGQEFQIPTLKECWEMFDEQQMNQYREWLEQGQLPKLSLTLIGLKLETVVDKIRAKRTEIKEKYPNLRLDENIVFLLRGIEEGELEYEPTGYDVSDPDRLVAEGGITKAEMIKKNRGCLVEIIPTIEDMDEHPEVDHRSTTWAQRTAQYHELDCKEGRRGLTYDSFLNIAARTLWEEGQTMEENFFTTLSDSALTNEEYVAAAGWRGGGIFLYYSYADDRNFDLRRRPSVRGNRKT